jgi:PAS domain S-box-containing protein
MSTSDDATAPLRDVQAARRQAQLALAESQETLELFINSVTDYALFLLDPQGHVLSWNSGAQQIKGYQPGEILGRHFSLFYSPEEQAQGRPEHNLLHAQAEGRFEDEGWRVRKDGTRFWANVVITALRDKKGVLRGFGKVTRDLTERKRAEEALRASEERFRLLVDSAQDYAIFMLDPTGHILTWNRGAQRIKGYEVSEILGQHFSRFYPPEDVAAGKPAWELQVASTKGRLEDEGWRVRKDGTRFWANVIITALRDEKGILRGFGKVTRDLTERKRAEEALRQSNVTLEQRVATRTAELQRSLEDLQQFAHIVAHDLQEPLRMVTSFVQLLAQRYQDRLDTNAGEYIGYAVEGTQRMYQLLQDLLAYARLEAGQDVRTPINLERVVADTLKILQPALTESGATVTHGPLPTVVAESKQVGQVVQNLLSNALKFRGPEAPRIHLWAQQQGDKWVIAVQDNGIGIEPQHVERIFGMFQRLHSREAYPGTGMGLAICRKIVERHGGRIWVESTPSQGATFFFTLPVL